MKNINDIILGVIGLGYVGLPLAVSFGKKIKVIGFDVNKERVKQLKNHNDITGETTTEDLLESKNLKFSSNLHDLTCCDVFIVAVPTGIDKNHNPDFFHLLKASETVGSVMKDGSIVIYESTVYPGCTEEECIPVLQKFSGKKFNEDFYVGYSPERINPGDKEHTFEKITKITSGSTKEVADFVDELYHLVLKNGTFKSSSIKTAEAAKVIENTQRDINIAFVNELSNIFSRLGIDTKQVLEAAETKWSFLKFKPGLVGGHCIGIDPYWLMYKALEKNYFPQLLNSARAINENISKDICVRIIQKMIDKDMKIKSSDVLILGYTFKENCHDIRNTKVYDIYHEFIERYKCNVDIVDPWAYKEDVKREYNIEIQNELIKNKKYDVVILAVSHEDFKEIDLSKLKKQKSVVFDVKCFLNKDDVDDRL